MISRTLRRALQGTAVAAMVAFIAVPSVMAVDPPAPPAPPVCFGAGMAAPILTDYIPPTATGRNYINIPRVGAVVGAAGGLVFNGNHAICNGMGLTATGNPATMASIDGDGTPDNADIIQFDGRHGVVNAYRCDQLVSGAPFDEGAGVEIRPNLSLAASVTTFVGGLECEQGYAVYETGGGKGINYLPITPLQACPNRVCLCHALGLPAGTKVQTIVSATGTVEDFICGAAVDPFLTGLPAGRSARIEPPGNTGAGAGNAVNCTGAAGIPCPTVAGEYTPMALTYPGLPLFPPGPTFPVPPFPRIYP